MVPPIEFSIGRTPQLARPVSTAAKTSSKAGQGRKVAVGSNFAPAASLYAPVSPWKAISMGDYGRGTLQKSNL